MQRPIAFRHNNSVDETGAWLSISDLMAGLLMVFALLLITTLAQLLEYEEQSKSNRVIIIEGLQKGLRNAGIDSTVDPSTGSVSLADSVLFEPGSSSLKIGGKQVLKKLVPVYSQVIFQTPEISQEVLYLVIEGHTDLNESNGSGMKLSINRAEAVVDYIDGMIFPYKGVFLRKILAAGRGNHDADPNLKAVENRKVLFRFEFQSHDLKDMVKSTKGTDSGE
jgi:outer membrane protein OmpA-like peptidoglycan-associated protein